MKRVQVCHQCLSNILKVWVQVRLCEQVRKKICNEPLQTSATDGAHVVLGNPPQSFSAWKSCVLKTFPYN